MIADRSNLLLETFLTIPLSFSPSESTSYEFNKGLLTFQYPEGRWPDSRRDLLALGFMTNQEDAVVLRLDSANSNDFMELEIVSVTKRCSLENIEEFVHKCGSIHLA